MDVPPSLLRAFVAVGEELHFGRAGLRLGVSQPQVSRRIRSLEEALGVQLFVRTPRQIKLTAAGSTLLVDAREALGAVDRLVHRASLAARGQGGRVAVGFVWSTLAPFLAPLVAAAAERRPGIELSVSQVGVRDLVPMLRRGDLDLAVVRPRYQDGEMIERRLRSEPFVIALPAGHELAGRERLTAEDLQGQPMIAIERAVAPHAYDAVLERIRDRGFDVSIARHVRSPAEALALVGAGLGMYRLPASAAFPHPGVVYREQIGPATAVVLIRRPEPPSPAVAAIEELAAEVLGDAQDASNNGGSGLVAAAARA